MKQSYFYLLLFLFATSCQSDRLLQEDVKIEKTEEHSQAFFEQDLENKNSFYRGLAMLYLDREYELANQLIREALQNEIEGAAASLEKPASLLSPEIAGSEYFKWQMRNWILVYYLFYDQSSRFPHRLDSQTQGLIEELFWNYLLEEKNHTIRRAEHRYLFDIHGSENHEIMRYGNLMLAAQALKKNEEYRNREVSGGLTVQDYFNTWNSYYGEYPLTRAKYGDMTELFSMYCVYTIPELFNLYDFAEDPIVIKRTKMLIDLIWADWAIAQINGIRGGVKTRIYQDPSRPDGREMERGGKDARWKNLSLIVFARDHWWLNHPMHKNSAHRIQGVTRVLASSTYSLPSIIKDIADDRAGLGEFIYVARRPAKQRPLPLEEIPVWYDPYYSYDREDSRMISYECCTPDFIMGSLVIDPTVPLVPSHLFYTEEKEGNKEGYTALSTQNRYHGIIFSTDSTARVLPQCMALKEGVTYGQQQAIQHKNIMIVQRDLKATNTGDMRIFFSEGMKDRVVEKGSWLFLEEGDAFLAVKAFSVKDGKSSCSYRWDNEFFIHLDNPQSPIVFIANRKSHIVSLEAFMESVLSFSTELHENKRFTLSGKDMDGGSISLSLYLECDQLPEVNGIPVDLRPEKIYDSPYLWSDHGSGIVHIRKGGRDLSLDFNIQTD